MRGRGNREGKPYVHDELNPFDGGPQDPRWEDWKGETRRARVLPKRPGPEKDARQKIAHIIRSERNHNPIVLPDFQTQLPRSVDMLF